MSELTTGQIQAMLARAEAATAGPWTVIGENKTEVLAGPNADPQIVVVDTRFFVDSTNALELEDATFIAAARTDVPLLAREVLRLREERDQLRESLRWALESYSFWRDPDDGRQYCKECGQPTGHRPDCRCAAAWKLLEEKP